MFISLWKYASSSGTVIRASRIHLPFCWLSDRYCEQAPTLNNSSVVLDIEYLTVTYYCDHGYIFSGGALLAGDTDSMKIRSCGGCQPINASTIGTCECQYSTCNIAQDFNTNSFQYEHRNRANVCKFGFCSNYKCFQILYLQTWIID